MALDDAVWPICVECLEESAKQTVSTEVSVDAIKTLQIMVKFKTNINFYENNLI